MMEELYAAGYHVDILSSPTHPNLIISTSTSHVPGDRTEDAADLYGLMETIWNRIKEEIEVSDFSVVGYSLGGTQAAFVAKLDEERKRFNFRKVLLINSAVSLYDSVARIEALLDKIPGGSRKIGVSSTACYPSSPRSTTRGISSASTTSSSARPTSPRSSARMRPGG